MKFRLRVANSTTILCGTLAPAADLRPARPNLLFIVVNNVDVESMGRSCGGTGLMRTPFQHGGWGSQRQ